MKQCENCRKFNLCWFPYPDPLQMISTEASQECIQFNYKYWELETKEQANKKAERKLLLFILLLMVFLIAGSMALLHIVT